LTRTSSVPDRNTGVLGCAGCPCAPGSANKAIRISNSTFAPWRSAYLEQDVAAGVRLRRLGLLSVLCELRGSTFVTIKT
jgi:hypothetical protein